MIPKMKKCTAISDDTSKSFVSTSERNIINRSTLMSASNYDCINDAKNAAYEHMVLMEDGVLDEMSTSTIHDQCQFPYYRSSKNRGRFPDAVLVKDVGVSCMLSDRNASTVHVPETKTLVKQLKKEYNDISNITNKITMYTKDILRHLKNKNKRKHRLLQHLISSKHVIASQYIDNTGNLCLKLRLYSNAETQCTPRNIKDVDNVFRDKCVTKKQRCKHSNSRKSCKNQTACQESTRSKLEKDIQTEILKENVEISTTNSSAPSTSSIYNYLTMRKRKTPSGKFNPVSTKLNDIHKHWNHKNCGSNKDHKEHLKRCEPVIFTNWKEISKSKQSKIKASSVISDESEEMTNTKKPTLQKSLLNYDMINNVPNTMFHTINIRIVEQSTKHV
nr:uncharacterized protein LOC117606547 isoform X2 [Osmia lignaria]